MLFSIALLFLCGIALGKIFDLLKLPKLVGMLLAGIILGPSVLNLLDPTILLISPDLRKIALVIILARAGLNLDIEDLRKVGRPAFLLCFVPACFEILGMVLLAPFLLGVTILEAAIMGAVVAAVSPAVIVPKMLRLQESGFGRDKSIPQMIMAGASVDDVFVIVLFTAFTGIAKDGNFSPTLFLAIPTSIVFGLGGGILAGLLLSFFFARIHVRDTGKVIILLSVAFLLVSLEQVATGPVGFSGLLAVMALGATIREKKLDLSRRLSGKFSKMWIGAELLLFALVGATVRLEYAMKAGLLAIVLVFGALAFRMVGVFISLLRTRLTRKERLFTAISYLPKATVQAAIGGIPLAMGLACGDMVLTVAVLSILLTAPLGAFLIDRTYQRLLSQAEKTKSANR